ncbi:hypothetical protein QUO16_004477 [Vibrio parahaemolyticus]|uniref:hypothetical protein n=1 Tax=Vibrio parahaemolyticus TaxID=670 RepID=UPI000A37533E|nr:hypothetical protein [Vibrio parahaemolyticus]ELA9373153.1 hypothetical protein [Vibrio parahaemolyticus]OUJ46632.1 hypothetical protein BTM22_24715 [Vibrio parahaemolyticus]TOE56336.1 hypothetical protein CGJ40_23435 [Vibrio parahaemolyticus]
MLKITAISLVALTLFGCSTSPNNNSNDNKVVSLDVADAMALCSSQYSSSQGASLEGWYLEHALKGKVAIEESVSGLVIDQSNLSSKDKVELAKLYYECVDSHAVKKKTLN